MAAVAPSLDSKAADLMQKLSLDSESKTIEAPESGKRNGSVFSTCQANGTSKPLYPNACFVPNGYPSTAYYYGGYDVQGNHWNAYGGMAQNVYGDNSSYMYHQGHGYTPYGAYPPHGSSTPTIQLDGQLFGLQQYQYPCPYYQSPIPADGTFAPNKHSIAQREISSANTVDHVTSSFVTNKGNTVSMVSDDCTNDNGFKAHLTSSLNSSLNSSDFYPGASLPSYVPLSGYQGPRYSTDGTQSAVPSDALLLSDRQYNHGAGVGLSSLVISGKDFSSQRNQNLAQPLPHYMNKQGSGPSSGLELVSGFMNRMYPSNTMYSQYGTTVRTSSHSGSAAYVSRAGYVGNKLKVSSNVSGGIDSLKKNMDGLGELNKGPRAKSSDNRSDKSLGPVTLLLKGQNLPKRSDNEEVPLAPIKEQYNGEGLSENYSDAKFFVIKSYSEDDIHKSIKYSVWASTPNGNKKLNAAYEEAKEKPGGCPVFLLFSVNTSGQFVGSAEMVGSFDSERTVEYWQQDRWTGCFPVKWHIIKDIPNVLLRHMRLENNENKPVTNSRDTQEVKLEQGIQILKIFKGHASKISILDDFDFYEAREKLLQERKSKQHQFSKNVSVLDDIGTNETKKLTESLDGTLMNQSAPTDAAAVKVKAKATPLEDIDLST